MGLAVVTVAAGGLPVVEAAGGLPVTEATNQFGLAVTKVIVGKPGLPVTYVVPAVTFTSFSPADKVATTLSNNNLTATSTAQGGVRTVAPITVKSYFEFTLGTFANGSDCVGIASATANLGTVGPTPLLAAVTYPSGVAYVNNASIGTTLGARSSGDVIGVAVDPTGNLIWFRVAPAGNWNGSAANNPATGVGGYSIAALTGSRYPLFASGPAASQAVTINLGAAAFAGAVPAGFAAGVL